MRGLLVAGGLLLLVAAVLLLLPRRAGTPPTSGIERDEARVERLPLLKGRTPDEDAPLGPFGGAPPPPEGVGRAIEPSSSDVVGRVVDPDGVSVRGAVVTAFVVEPGGRREDLGSVGTAAMGRFWLPLSHPAETVHLEIHGPSWAEEPYAPTVVYDVATGRGGGVVELEPGVWLAGRVVDEAGEGIDGATVVLWDSAAGPVQTRRTETSAGAFRFAVARGTFRLFAWSGERTEGPSAAVEVGAPADAVRLVCPNAVPLSGRLEGPDVEGFGVGWARPAPDGTAHGEVVRVGADGRFAFAHVPPELVVLYTTHAADDRCAVLRVDPRVDAEPVLVLEPALGIEGWIRPPPGEDGGWLRAWDLQLLVWRGASVEPDGRFRVRGLPPGRYDVHLDGNVLARDVRAGTEGLVLEAVASDR